MKHRLAVLDHAEEVTGNVRRGRVAVDRVAESGTRHYNPVFYPVLPP